MTYSKICKSPLVIALLLLASTTHASSDYLIVDDKPNTTEQCIKDYNAVVERPLIQLQDPMINDEQKVEEIEIFKKFADDHISDIDVAYFPETLYLDKDSPLAILAKSNQMSYEDAMYLQLYLYKAYATGQYVPKNEYKAVHYLSKAVDFYEYLYPERTSEFIYLLMMYYPIDEDNSTLPIDGHTDEGTLKMISLLIKAGSLDAKAALLAKGIKTSDLACKQIFEPQLIELAEQNSHWAIDELKELYEHLYDAHPTYYKEQMTYWQQQAEKRPMINLNFSSL